MSRPADTTSRSGLRRTKAWKAVQALIEEYGFFAVDECLFAYGVEHGFVEPEGDTVTEETSG